MSNKLSQVEAVVKVVTEVLGDSFVSGQTVARNVITKQQKQEVADKIIAGITNGTVAFDKDASDPKKLTRYVKGMVNNHLTRSKKLNGGTPYKATTKAKATTAVKSLKQLVAQLQTLDSNTPQYQETADKIREVQQQIAKHQGAINTTFLPNEVKEFVNTIKNS